MRYFRPEEFGEWYSLMSPELLDLLDELRHRHGAPIVISPVNGALGRRKGPHHMSDHNVDKWGEVRAADVFPTMAQSPTAARGFWNLALEVGVSALGVYPHWRNAQGEQQVGYHIGYRPARVGNPARWAMVGRPQRMVPYTDAFEEVK